MPPMPPQPPGIAGSFLSSGSSATSASVVSRSEAIDAAFCSAERVTLVGSMTPAAMRSSHFSSCALKPNDPSFSFVCETMIAPSWPALIAI